jgi:hypothetical protein
MKKHDMDHVKNKLRKGATILHADLLTRQQKRRT